MQKNELIEEEFSFKEYFIPLTNAKAITWIIVIGLIVYFISLFNGFVWDDLPQYLNNPITHSILNTPQIIANRLSTFYRPFPTILFSAIYILFGPTAFWYHLFQVVLFLITTVLFYLLLKKFVSRSLAFLLSIIFLIHPMNVESVAYISSSQTVLSLLFGLLALFVLENEKLRDVYKYSMVFLFLLFSILSKENGWIFFILIPLFMYFNKSKRFIRKDYLFFTVSCLLIICIYSSFILIFPGLNGTITEPIPILHAPLSIRLLTLPKIIFYYIYTFVFPLQLGVTQQWLVTQVDFQNFVFPLLVDSIFFISILLSGNYIYRKHSKLFMPFIFFALWFFLNFAIVWQIVPLEMTVADRWFYFPMLGLLGMLGILISTIKLKSNSINYFVVTLIILVIISFSIRTMVRIGDWKDGITLFSHDKSVSYQSYELYNELGYNYLLAQRNDEAKPNLDKAVQLAPKSWESWSNLGTYYANTNQLDKAIKSFSTALSINNNYYPAYLNLIRIYYFTGKLSQTINLAVRALSIFPQEPYFWSVKGAADYRLSNKQQGIDEEQKAYNLSQDAFYLNLLNLMQNNQDISNIH